MFTAKQNTPGFTIVELLIVIVVIGILATITIATYNGVQQRAADIAVQTDLRNIGGKIEQYYALNGSYPITTSNNITDFTSKVAKSSYDVSGNNLYYCTIATGATPQYSVSARSISGKVFAYYNGTFQDFTGTFSTNTAVCSGAGGISSAAPNYYYSNAHVNTTKTWRSWIE